MIKNPGQDPLQRNWVSVDVNVDVNAWLWLVTVISGQSMLLCPSLCNYYSYDTGTMIAVYHEHLTVYANCPKLLQVWCTKLTILFLSQEFALRFCETGPRYFNTSIWEEAIVHIWDLGLLGANQDPWVRWIQILVNACFFFDLSTITS